MLLQEYNLLIYLTELSTRVGWQLSHSKMFELVTIDDQQQDFTIDDDDDDDDNNNNNRRVFVGQDCNSGLILD